MSTPLNFTSPVGKAPAPKGTEVASFRTYAEAQSAVDALAEADYPVHTLTIIGTDLVMVERVTGRATAGKAFARGALNGLWWGVMLGLLSAFINPDLGGAAIIITAGVITLIFGLINVAVHAIAGKKRRQDYTSVTSQPSSPLMGFVFLMPKRQSGTPKLDMAVTAVPLPQKRARRALKTRNSPLIVTNTALLGAGIRRSWTYHIKGQIAASES